MLLAVLGSEGKLAGQRLIAYKGYLQSVGTVLQPRDIKVSVNIGNGSLHQLACRCLDHYIYKLHRFVGLLIKYFSSDRTLSKYHDGTH